MGLVHVSEIIPEAWAELKARGRLAEEADRLERHGYQHSAELIRRALRETPLGEWPVTAEAEAAAAKELAVG